MILPLTKFCISNSDRLLEMGAGGGTAVAIVFAGILGAVVI